MIVKRNHKNYKMRIFICLLVFYASMRVMALYETTEHFDFEHLSIVFENIYKLWTPLVLNARAIMVSFFATFFCFAWMESMTLKTRKNMQENTHGSADWGDPSDLKKLHDKEYINNLLLTKTEMITKDMSKSNLTRHITLIGMPGTGKSRGYFKPNILSANGTLIMTDPKGELLRDTGYSLTQKGYTIKVLNLIDKEKGNRFNPLAYIRPREIEVNQKMLLDATFADYRIEEGFKEDDVMTMVNSIMANTKSEQIETATGDPFWEKAETLFTQALMYLILYSFPKDKQDFVTFMDLLSMCRPDDNGNSEIDELFYKLQMTHGKNNIAVKQWDNFKVSAKSPKTMNTILMATITRFSPFNISDIQNLVRDDDMELYRIGKAGDEGKIAYFIVVSPGDTTFNFIANLFYTQIFNILDYNATQLGTGSLPTNVDMYMDEWAQLGIIPRFEQQLAYVRGLNVGITIGLQSLSQLKKVYKDNWDAILDCCDFTLFMGSKSDTTRKYMSELLGKKTWYKKSIGRTYSKQGSSSINQDVVGRELATSDEIARMAKGKCILHIAGDFNPFYSDVYKVNNHPYYDDLYEPRNTNLENMRKRYDHLKAMQTNAEEKKMMDACKKLGFHVEKITSQAKTHRVTKEELTSLLDDETLVMNTNKEAVNNLLGGAEHARI